MDAAIPADAQNAPTGIWKSRTEREIPTAPTPIIVVVNERKNNGDSNSVAKLSTESDQAQRPLIDVQVGSDGLALDLPGCSRLRRTATCGAHDCDASPHQRDLSHYCLPYRPQSYLCCHPKPQSPVLSVSMSGSSQLREVVGLTARIDGRVVRMNVVVRQDAHIATVRAQRERVVLRDPAEGRKGPRSRRGAAVHGARGSADSTRDADAPRPSAAPRRWVAADRRSPPRPHTRVPDSPSNRSRERSSSSWWPCVPTRPGDAPTPSPATCARTARRSPCVPRRGDDDARRAGRSAAAPRSGWLNVRLHVTAKALRFAEKATLIPQIT